MKIITTLLIIFFFNLSSFSFIQIKKEIFGNYEEISAFPEIDSSIKKTETGYESLKNVNKKPLLIYYAIDTDEPFLKDAVYSEINSLKKICNNKYSYFNWIAIANSFFSREAYDCESYKKNKVLLYCENGSLKQTELEKSIADFIKKNGYSGFSVDVIITSYAISQKNCLFFSKTALNKKND